MGVARLYERMAGKLGCISGLSVAELDPRKVQAHLAHPSRPLPNVQLAETMLSLAQEPVVLVHSSPVGVVLVLVVVLLLLLVVVVVMVVMVGPSIIPWHIRRVRALVVMVVVLVQVAGVAACFGPTSCCSAHLPHAAPVHAAHHGLVARGRPHKS